MKTCAFLNEYVKRLSDEELGFLSTRFKQCLVGDTSDIMNMLSCDPNIDKWLGSSTGSDDLYDMLDTVAKQVKDESVRRFGADTDNN